MKLLMSRAACSVCAGLAAILLSGAVAAAAAGPTGFYGGTTSKVGLGIQLNNGKLKFLEFDDQSSWHAKPKNRKQYCATGSPSAPYFRTDDNTLTTYPYKFKGHVKANGHFKFTVIDHNGGGGFTAVLTGKVLSSSTLSLTIKVNYPSHPRQVKKAIQCKTTQSLTLTKSG